MKKEGGEELDPIEELIAMGRETLELATNCPKDRKCFSGSEGPCHCVKGIDKLRRRLSAEIKYLESPKGKKNAGQCSNLHHLKGIVERMHKEPGIIGVLQPFPCCSVSSDLKSNNPKGKRIEVDVVGDEGRTWVKVIARNPKSLHMNATGEGSYGQRSIVDQGQDFVKVSRDHPVRFHPPLVRFAFLNGLTEEVEKELTSLGVRVEIGPPSKERIFYGNDDGISGVLNLDVSTMLAYASELTNSSPQGMIFREPILSEQAEWERKRPLKPILDRLFENRELVCCETAVKDFESILATVGGPKEKERSKEFILRVRVIPDNPSDRVRSLNSNGKMKERSRIVFGTADAMECVTVSANSGFCRAATAQGIHLSVFLHESRALTEQKQILIP
ncbi:unnamed protein product [Darwinula stevensoni]|uniref:DUF1308 domain-containing protein n=1 Tax=Darwinula stevensoni TaxID=69355 RepID=A0A7R9FR97_9CRUS|nr:unnamed protein product [Darwinula stevensoni]CAG0901260.1 unnamed protein product [Darwinula stevensoni]